MIYSKLEFLHKQILAQIHCDRDFLFRWEFLEGFVNNRFLGNKGPKFGLDYGDEHAAEAHHLFLSKLVSLK